MKMAILYLNNRGMIHTWKISNPAMSRIPMNEAPCLFVRSNDLLIRWTIHLNIRS